MRAVHKTQAISHALCFIPLCVLFLRKQKPLLSPPFRPVACSTGRFAFLLFNAKSQRPRFCGNGLIAPISKQRNMSDLVRISAMFKHEPR